MFTEMKDIQDVANEKMELQNSTRVKNSVPSALRLLSDRSDPGCCLSVSLWLSLASERSQRNCHWGSRAGWKARE